MPSARLITFVLAATVSGGLAGTGVSAASARPPAGGPVRMFITSISGGPKATAVVTGAIGGRGSAVYLKNNDYVKITVHQGATVGSSLEANVTALTDKANKASFPIDKAACTSEGTITGTATLIDGTGDFKGISGMLNVTMTFAWTMPRYATGAKKGQCDGPEAVLYELVEGSGTVSFS